MKATDELEKWRELGESPNAVADTLSGFMEEMTRLRVQLAAHEHKAVIGKAMERLTVDTKISFCDIAQCRELLGGAHCPDGYCDQRRCYERLREYERTGVAPEAVVGAVPARWVALEGAPLPCPCCGGEAELKVGNLYGAPSARVCCKRCRLSTMQYPEGFTHGMDISTRHSIKECKAHAIESWNQRIWPTLSVGTNRGETECISQSMQQTSLTQWPSARNFTMKIILCRRTQVYRKNAAMTTVLHFANERLRRIGGLRKSRGGGDEQ